MTTKTKVIIVLGVYATLAYLRKMSWNDKGFIGNFLDPIGTVQSLGHKPNNN